jgi:hypothetical protein
MDQIRTAPRRAYHFITSIVEMILIFFYSIFYLTKPSDSLDRNDIDDLRRGRKPSGNNGNDMNYKGKRSDSRFYMGG